MAFGVQFDTTLGAQLVGLMFALCFYGGTCLQMIFYFVAYPRDQNIFKYFVAVLWTLDTLHTVLICYTVYYYAVTNFLDPFALLSGVWSVNAQIGVMAAIMLVNQGFFVMRVWKISQKKKALVAILMFIVCTQTGFALAATVELFRIHLFARVEEIKWLLITALAFIAVADITVTLTITYYLHKSRKEYRGTQSAITTMILWTINTGALTSFAVTLNAIFIVTMQNNMIFVGMSFITPKLYTNSTLATLNTRRLLRAREKNSQGLLSFSIVSSPTRTHTISKTLSPQTLSPQSPIANEKNLAMMERAFYRPAYAREWENHYTATMSRPGEDFHPIPSAV